MQNLPWIVAFVAMTLLALVLLALAFQGIGRGTWRWRDNRQAGSAALPTEWALTARPVFAADERRVHRLLREALPQHVVLSKLQLARFCQPTDTSEARFWYELLDNSHVTFAVCSPSGRVLAAIDLDSQRAESPRCLHIKQSALDACRVRYLRCSADQLPSLAELQSLVPSMAVATSPSAPESKRVSPSRRHPGDDLAAGTSHAQRGSERIIVPLWQDAAALHDSFFAAEPGLDSRGGRQHPPVASDMDAAAKAPGVVVEPRRFDVDSRR